MDRREILPPEQQVPLNEVLENLYTRFAGDSLSPEEIKAKAEESAARLSKKWEEPQELNQETVQKLGNITARYTSELE